MQESLLLFQPILRAGSANIEKVFQLILDTAWSNNCAPEDMPQKLYIISDMQFDMATTTDAWYTRPYNRRKPEPFMAQMKKRFELAGYNMPTIVYWNDGTKTVVKCQDSDVYDTEKGLAMAISKKAVGNKGNFNNIFKEWVKN